MPGTANEYRREAEAMDRLAKILSYGPDKQRLTAKASEYRSLAAALDRPPEPRSFARKPAPFRETEH